MSRVWFITGCSTGLGRATLERILAQGDRAIATLRNPSALSSLTSTYPPTQLLVLALDVTSPQHLIQAAFEQGIKAFGRIDVVLSNAGSSGVTGEAESVPEEKARRTMEINFWGATRVAREGVRVFRDVNKEPQGGLFLQVSSSVGIEGQALTAFYAASKFAIEGWFDAFTRELDPKWNINIKIINPGGFDTNLGQNGELLPAHPAYTSLPPDHPSVQMRTGFEMVLHQGLDIGLPKPESFVDALMNFVAIVDSDSVESKKLPLRVPIGNDAVYSFRSKAGSLSDSVEKYEVLSRDIKSWGSS